ncbi:UNVERIFIED_CONTAM: hypothetical protein HDU68_006444 [Siphonaria sp. JEL0065]|nr:hypothetical protein HDU68_006444 [Siphonaria sp. JEL0065]
MPFASRLASAVPEAPVAQISNTQAESLAALTATEASLASFNTFSANRFETNADRINTHVTMLKTMKADLDSVFRRIRALKSKLAKKYPEHYRDAVSRANLSDLSLEDDDDE